MAPLLSAVIIVLTAAIAVNVLLLLKAARHIQALAARLWPMKKLLKLPPVGTRVATFQTLTADGSVITDADISDGVHYVVFALVGCKVCKLQIAAMRTSGRHDPARTTLFVVADDPATEDAASLVEDLRDLGTVALMNRQNPVSPAVGGIAGYPTLLRFESGVLSAAGSKWAEVVAEPAGMPIRVASAVTRGL